MKCNVNRLLSLALVLVMLVGILPLTGTPVEAKESTYVFDEVLMDDNFDNATISAFTAAGTNQVLNSDGFTEENLKTYCSRDADRTAYGLWSVENDAAQGNHIKLVKTIGTRTGETKPASKACHLYAQIYTDYYAELDAWYRFTWKAKVDAGCKGAVYIRNCAVSSSDETNGYTNSSFTNTEWQTFSLEFKATAAKTFQIGFGNDADDSGCVAYFDDFKLEKIVDPYPIIDDVIYENDFSSSLGLGGEAALKPYFVLEDGILKQTAAGRWRYKNDSNAYVYLYSQEEYDEAVAAGYSPVRFSEGNYFDLRSDATLPETYMKPKAGVTYTYSIDYKTDSTGGMYWYFGTVKSNGGWAGTSYVTVATTTVDHNNGWMTATFEYTVTEDNITAGAVGFRAYVGLDQNCTKGDVVYYDNMSIKANLTQEEAVTYGFPMKLMADTELDSLALGETGILDLNGYTLTVNSLTGAAGAQLYDSSETNTGKIVVGVTDGADNFTLATTTGELPVRISTDGTTSTYIMVNPGVDATYVKMHKQDATGFTYVFRPGFGKADGQSVATNYISQGADITGITMKVYINDAALDVSDDLIKTCYGNSAAMKLVATNPTAATTYTIKVVITSSTTGTTITSVETNYSAE